MCDSCPTPGSKRRGRISLGAGAMLATVATLAAFAIVSLSAGGQSQDCGGAENSWRGYERDLTAAVVRGDDIRSLDQLTADYSVTLQASDLLACPDIERRVAEAGSTVQTVCPPCADTLGRLRAT